jgi:uncharacterized SAM-binding protein YcdF (DUF218 family)
MVEALLMLTQPFALLLISLAVMLVIGMRRNLPGKRCRVAGIVLIAATWLGSTPLLSHCLFVPLERSNQPLKRWPSDCETIVVLGGSICESSNERLVARLGESSLHRCLEAARLYHANGRPRIVVSGGSMASDPGGETVSQGMKECLLELGVAANDLFIENRSRTTFENSKETLQLVKGWGIDHIVLVTDAAHMPRALECFNGHGVEVTPARCHFQASRLPSAAYWLIPTPSAWSKAQYALHEHLGRVWYRLTGRAQH